MRFIPGLSKSKTFIIPVVSSLLQQFEWSGRRISPTTGSLLLWYCQYNLVSSYHPRFPHFSVIMWSIPTLSFLSILYRKIQEGSDPDTGRNNCCFSCCDSINLNLWDVLSSKQQDRDVQEKGMDVNRWHKSICRYGKKSVLYIDRYQTRY